MSASENQEPGVERDTPRDPPIAEPPEPHGRAPAAPTAPGGDKVQLVVVTIGPDEYAIPIERVQEVVRYMRPRPLPHSDANVLGVIDLRGRVLPLVSARASFGLADEDLPEDAKVAVINIGDTRVGLVVDDVFEVLGAPRSLIVPPPERAGTRAL